MGVYWAIVETKVEIEAKTRRIAMQLLKKNPPVINIGGVSCNRGTYSLKNIGFRIAELWKRD